VKEAVGDVIALRAHDPSGLKKMMSWSFAVHVGVIAFIAFVPRNWLFATKAESPVMIISLAGPPGPNTGGLTPMGGRPIEQVAPEPKRQPPTPLAASTAAAAPNSAKTKQPPQPTEPMPTETTVPRPTTGRQARAGTTAADTGARGQGTGMSQGGGGGATPMVDIVDFCCMDYVLKIRELIRENWDGNQPDQGTNVIKFEIRRDGTINVPKVEVEKSSGYRLLDLQSRKAVELTKSLPPLPDRYTGATLTIHLTFEYKAK
jgi:TonB family protein